MTGVIIRRKEETRMGRRRSRDGKEDQADMGRGRRELPESLQREPCPGTRLWNLTPWFLTPGL